MFGMYISQIKYIEKLLLMLLNVFDVFDHYQSKICMTLVVVIVQAFVC